MKAKMAIIAAAILIVTCAVHLTGGIGEARDAGSKKETLVVALNAEPSVLDPHGSMGIPDRRAMRQIYDTLIVQDESMNIVPALATKWEFKDDSTIVFELRKNVKWHNGEPFRANDVKYSLQRAIDSNFTARYVNMIDIENTKVIDDATIEVKLKQPFGPILSHLAYTAIAMVNEKAVSEAGNGYGRNPVGTGPFKFSKWTAGDRIEFDVNENYWGEKPAFKHLIMRVVTEDANRAIELETGGVDIAYEITANDIGRLEKNKNTWISRIPNFATTFIGFNCAKEPMSNPKVRQAVAYALNTSEIIEAVFFGTGELGKGPLPSTVWGFYDGIKPYPYDVEKAKSLMAEAGIKGDIPILLYTNDNQQRITIAEIAQNQLKQIGMNVQTKIVEQAAYLPALENKEEDMYILSWTTVTGDADFGLYMQYTTASFGKGGNRSFYSNPKVDALLELGRNSVDDAERKEAYGEAQVLITEDAPAVYLWQGESIFGLRKGISGFKNMPSGIVSLAEVVFE